MTRAVIFTHPPDYVRASYAARSLRAAGIEPVLAVDAGDPPIRMEGLRVIRTHAPRMRNLNGMPWIREQLRVLRDQGEGGEWVLKVDSDTMVFSDHWFVDRPEIAVGLTDAGRRELYGMVYALRTAALPAMIAAADAMPEDGYAPEDIFVSRIARSVGPVHVYQHGPGCPLGPHDWNDTRSPAEIRRERGALCFQLTHGRGLRAATATMKTFLP